MSAAAGHITRLETLAEAVKDKNKKQKNKKKKTQDDGEFEPRRFFLFKMDVL